MRNKTLLVLAIMLALIMIELITFGQIKPNCWNQYQTENQAITKCERH